MSARRAIQVALLLVVIVTLGVLFRPQSEAPDDLTVQATADTEISYTAYYFHGDRRCDTCRAIESQSAEAVQSGFSEELDDGTLTWSAVNTDKPENAHFAEEFGLTHSTVVLVEREGSRTVRFAQLDRVWELVHEEEGFRDYVQAELRGWMSSGS